MTLSWSKAVRGFGLACCCLLPAACGSPGGGPAHPSSTAPATPAAVDKGPQCEGDKAAKGLHLFSLAATALPGGASVTYAEGRSDGAHRTAELTTGSTRQTVRPAQRVDLGGHTYTVAQICTYRVVLTGPGLTVLKRIPRGPYSFDSDLEKFSTAAFAAQ